jgi:zinc protease
MTAMLLDEGAGGRDSAAFQAALEDNAIRLSFGAEADAVTGSLRTLAATRPLAVELLHDALTAPRFDAEPVERVRAQMTAELRRREADPGYLASRTWLAAAFPGHAYGTPQLGRPETVAAIGVGDLRAAARDRLARDRLAIGVSGDIAPGELAELLDATFGHLPERAATPELPSATPVTGRTVVERRPIPQSVVWFGRAGIAIHDPDYWPAVVVDYLMGGGGFRSRLMQEVREARGLAYSVWSTLQQLERAPLWIGGVATSNERVAQSVALVREETAKVAAGALTPEDLADAVTYLTGSFPLRLTSNDQVAGMLASMMANRLGADFIARRNGLIAAVTLDDARRVAARLLGGDLLVAVVGDPDGIEG